MTIAFPAAPLLTVILALVGKFTSWKLSGYGSDPGLTQDSQKKQLNLLNQSNQGQGSDRWQVMPSNPSLIGLLLGL